jgi:DNA-binding phage protein
VAAGRTLTAIAVAAGLDRTTLNRVLRPDVKRVRASTSAALLAVG